MELKLSNVLNNLDEFFKRQENLNISIIRRDKSKNIHINKFLMTQIFKNFFIDVIQQQNESNNFKKIFDYSEEELKSLRDGFKELNRTGKNDVVLLLYSKNLELFKQPKPINLMEKYSYVRQKEFTENFEIFKEKINGFVDKNIEYNLSVGNIIQFKNGHNIEMITKILGFDSDGDCYLLWDCYWSPIRLNERFTKLISKK